MEQTTLGGSGLRVPRLAVGCAHFGLRLGEQCAIHLVNTAIDLGIRFFDTADVYAGGESERILGKAVKGKRDCCVIGTKFRFSPELPGASRKSIRAAVEGSLRRLGVDYIDLYQMHGPDPTTPIEETIATLQDLVGEGKILYFGLCNVKAWQAVDAQRVAWHSGRAPLVSMQALINAIDLRAYRELQPVMEPFKLGLLAAAPLARGMLSGSYCDADPPPEHPLRSGKGIGYWNDAGRAAAARVRKVARELSRPPVHIALGVLLSLPQINSLLVGPNSTEQLIQCGGSVGNFLDESMIRYVLRGAERVEPSAPDELPENDDKR